MLKKFTLKNYKNFKNELVLDLDKVAGYKFNTDCIKDDTISKSIIYGRNATGKTNLGKAIADIVDTVIGGIRLYNFSKEKIANVDSDNDSVTFKYEFQFDDKNVVYFYKRNQFDDLEYESLYVNQDQIYEINFEQEMFSAFALDKIEAQTIQIDKYLSLIKSKNEIIEIVEEEREQIPFLRYLLTNGAIVPDSVLYKLEEYVKKMRFYSVAQQLFIRRSKMVVSFTDYLGEKENLNRFEEFLNVMGVECELITYKSVDGHFELFFKHKKPIPFYENASSGTLALTNFYMRYVAVNREPSFIYMDEFDAFYHYEMSERLVKYFKAKYPETQVVMTTHNTNLMSNHLMRPDCLFILSRDGRLTALCNATERELREGHNLEKLYIGGEFEQYE